MKKVRDARKGDRTPWWTALSDARLERLNGTGREAVVIDVRDNVGDMTRAGDDPDDPLPVLDNDGSIG